MSPQERLGANVRRLRHARGLTQEALAHRCGLHSTEVGRLERGVRDARLSTIVKVAGGLGVEPNALLDGLP